MRVKRFVARSLPEAMVQVKAELGPEAVILHTNEIRVGGLWGLFGRRMIQVMAAVEERAPAGGAALRAAAAAAPVATPVAAPRAPAPQADGVQQEMASMKAMMTRIMERLDQPAPPTQSDPRLQPLLALMARGGVEGEAARDLVARVRARTERGEGRWENAAEQARLLMEEDLSGVATVDGTGGRVIALVGPTGVGKTTTLAKLAAHLSLQQRRRVALITADTYRIAAVEQLRTYSEIIGVPLEVVYEPGEVRPALEAHSDCDVILVDTAGRSPRNPVHMAELKAYLEALAPAETYLVMSLTSAYRDALAIADNYLPLGFDRFLFTKWDEASAPGLIYSIVHKYKRPLSYITTGQNVPDDIEVADPHTITTAILGD